MTDTSIRASGIFDTSTEYYQFVVRMKENCPETNIDSWLRDSRAKFIYNQGYTDGRTFDNKHTTYLIERLRAEERKRKKLVELLRGKGVQVDASGDDIIINTYE